MGINSDFWAQRRVLITGHTGFKGAWLSLWLQALGAEVTGLAPGPPTRPSLYELAAVGANMCEHAVDVRDPDAVAQALRAARPEVLLHLAAQPMVRRSLRDPVTTFQINLIGTVNVLDAVRRVGGGVRAVVVVTSDKCYETTAAHDRGETAPFVESDRLGGADPYSGSKACCELATDTFRRSYFSAEDAPRVATARAGNVIGGGDWGEDRLLADIVRAAETGTPLRVRNPDAIRPWQHVLNPLSGYLRLAEELARSPAAARAWNFGPGDGDERTVRWIVERLSSLWPGALAWEPDDAANPPETKRLALDSSAAERLLGWRPGWNLEQALGRLVEWHQARASGQDMRRVSVAQVERFEHDLASLPGSC